MPTSAWQTCTGEGSYAFDSGNPHSVNEIQTSVGTITSPRVRILDTTAPMRIMYGGRMGLALTGNNQAGTSTLITMGEWALQWTDTDMNNMFLNQYPAYASHVIWKIPPGITWYMRVTWS